MHHGAAMMTARDSAGAVVPADPSGVSASQLTVTSVRVSWNDNAINEDEYRVYRSKDGGAYSLHATLGSSVESYDDTGLTEGSEYCYKVAAANEQGESTQVGPACETPLSDEPAAPSSVRADTVSASEIDVLWTDESDNEDEFKIYRRLYGTSSWTLAGTVGANVESFRDSGLDEATEYEYRVDACNTGGCTTGTSVGSADNRATTQFKAPSNLEKSVKNSGTNFEYVTFSWTNNSSEYSEVEIYKDGSLHDTVEAGTSSYDVNCDTATGSWKVRANGSGAPASDFSNTESHTCG